MTIETVPENDRVERFVATEGETVFPFDFPIYEASHMRVLRDRAGVQTQLVLGVDYSLTGAGTQAGGTVTLTSPALAGDIISLQSRQPVAKTTLFQDGGELRAKALNDEFNRLVIALQQVLLTRDLTLKVAATDPVPLPLPPVADRAGRYMFFDSAGNPVASSGTPGIVPVSTFMATLLDDTSASAALTTLGVSAFIQTLLDDADAETARATLGARTHAGTAVAATGSTVEFTGIPANVRQVVALFSGLSTAAAVNPMVQVGDTGGFVTSGYLGAETFIDGTIVASTVNFIDGFRLGGSNPANLLHGALTLDRLTGNTWVATLTAALSSSSASSFGAGSITLTNPLDRLRFTAGASTFDAGTVNVIWRF